MSELPAPPSSAPARLQGYVCESKLCGREFFVHRIEEAYMCPTCGCSTITELTGPFSMTAGVAPSSAPARSPADLIAQWRNQADRERKFDAPLGGRAIGRGIAGVFDNCADELAEALRVGVPAPPRLTAADIEVGCEREDGTLNIHAGTETCELCAGRVAPSLHELSERLRFANAIAEPDDLRARVEEIAAELAALSGSPQAEDTAEIERLKAKYFELLYAVATKHPGESRHDTALRYIRQREQPSNQAAAASRVAPSPDQEPPA